MHKKRRGFKKKMVFALTILAIFFISLSTSIWGKDAEEPLISLNVVEMSIYDVLRLIAKEAGLNMVIKKEVRDEVTLRVKNANLWQVLETILENTGFTYQKKDGIIVIAELEEIKEKTEESLPITEIIFLNFLRGADARNICRRFLSPSGVIEIEPKTNALLLIDLPENIKKVQQVIMKLNIRPSQFLLTGIISDSESSLAMINGEILRFGEMIKGLTVSEIGQNTVTLEKEDLVIVLVLR